MQLKTIGESLSAVKSIENVLNATANFRGLTGVAETTRRLKDATKGYSLEAVKAAISQSTLNKEQIKAILSQQGLQGELLETTADQLANVASTNAVTQAQKGATASTLGLRNAFKGLWASIKKWVVAHPYLATLIGIGATIGILVKAYDALNISLEEHRENLEKATEKLEETKSEIESLNSELETTKERIKELEGLETPSLVEEQELEQLKQQNKELERELRIKRELEKFNQAEVNKKAYMYFNNPLNVFGLGNNETPLEEAKRNIEEIQTLRNNF